MKKNYKTKITISFIMIFTIVVSSLVPSFSSYAESNEYDFIQLFGLTENSVLTKEDFQNSEVYDSNYSSRFISSSATAVTNYKNLLINYPSRFKVSMDSSLFTDEVFCWVTSDTATSFDFYTYPSGSYILFGTNGDFCVVCPSDFNYGTVNGYKATGGLNVSNGNLEGRTVYSYLTQTTMGGQTVVRTDVYTNSSAMFFITSLPIRYYNGRLNGNTDLSNISDTDLNFNPTNGGFYNEEGSSNNLTMKDPDFKFTNSNFYAPYSSVINTGSIYPQGFISFSFTPNHYQLEHLEQFTVSLSFSFDYDVNYLLEGNNDNPPFYHKGLTSNKKNCSLRFIYNDDGAEYIDIPLSSFNSNGNIYSISFEDVLSHMSGSSYTYANVLQLSKELTSCEYNKFNLNCTAFISSGSESSGFYSEWYNPINKKGYTTDKSAEVNKNPYYNDSADGNEVDDSTPLYTPGTAGTGGDNANNVGGGSNNNSVTVGGSSSSTGAINITNNNTAYGGSSSSIASGDGSSGFGSFLSTLITLLADGQSSSSETIASISDSNGWMTVANTSLSAVPTSLWTTLLTTFTVCVAISVVACVISLLLKIFF